jgi:hypothetical protein
MEAAFVILIIGVIVTVLGLAEIKRAAAQGVGTAVAGIVFTALGGVLIIVALVRGIFWT